MFDNFSLDDEIEVLKSFMPQALKEGALLVEFKEKLDQGISKASILTLNEEETVGSKPNQDQDDCGTWCFNLKRRCWVWLNYKDIDAVQPWPLIDPETTTDLQYQTPLLT